MISAEEKVVDPALGYPTGYAKLCRNAHKQMRGLITPYTDGPPQHYLPYARQEDEASKLKEWDSLFPTLPEQHRDSPNARKYADVLWQQMDHLGNAGFDPAKFRVDTYGNVVYYYADPASPLFWEVDHWFPHSRGGRTVISNLRIVQWQVNQRKNDKLEFLVPWWELQLGVSVNQFLSAFSSKNAEFRRRCFSYMFLEPASHNFDAFSHSWPAPFRDKKAQLGLAPASLVKVAREPENSLVCKGAEFKCVQSSANPPTPGGRRRWSVDEEEALRRALQRFGPGNWKEIKEYEPALANRSTVQIKDKYRLMKGDLNMDKENVTAVGASAALQKELQMKALKEEERRAKEAEIAQLEQSVNEIRGQNSMEENAIKELEFILEDHRNQVEKQRRWAETQSSYKLCLERMIRDSLHQNAVYKEQARLNQAACNVLMARLDTLKTNCVAAEHELVTRFNERKALDLVVHGGPTPVPSVKGADVVDVSSCLSTVQGHVADALSQGELCEDPNFVRVEKKAAEETALQEEPKLPQLSDHPEEVEERNKDAEPAPELEVLVVGYEYEQHREKENTPEDEIGVEDDPVHAFGDVEVHHQQCQGNQTPLASTEQSEGSQEVSSASKKLSASATKSKGLIGGLLRRLNFKQHLDAVQASNKSAGSPGSKEWEDLAVKMGEVTIGEVVNNEKQERSQKVDTKNEEQEDDGASMNYEDATCGSLAGTEPTSSSETRKSLFSSLHEEEDAESCNRSTQLAFEWNSKEQVKNGFVKICTQAWMKARKKLEARIQDGEHGGREGANELKTEPGPLQSEELALLKRRSCQETS